MTDPPESEKLSLARRTRHMKAVSIARAQFCFSFVWILFFLSFYGRSMPVNMPVVFQWHTVDTPNQTNGFPDPTSKEKDVKPILRPPTVKDVMAPKCAKNEGVIISNMLGRTANNLFEVALANRLSEELCWPIIFRPAWQSAILKDHRPAQCFPNALSTFGRPFNRSIEEWEREWFSWMEIANSTNQEWDSPETFFIDIAKKACKKCYDSWKQHAIQMGTMLHIGSKDSFDFHNGWDNNLVEKLRRPGNSTFVNKFEKTKGNTIERPYDNIRTIDLGAFFIQYDWMQPWMSKIQRWLKMDDKECCHHLPKENTVVIHVRDFAAEGAKRLDAGFQHEVYFELLDKFYFGPNHSHQYDLWIVCQPKDAERSLIQTLLSRYNATIVTGTDPYDAFCTLRRAQHLILSTSSSFSQMGAVLADSGTEVHYFLPKLTSAKVTLAVPHWNYHYVNEKTKDRIETWNVGHKAFPNRMWR